MCSVFFQLINHIPAPAGSRYIINLFSERLANPKDSSFAYVEKMINNLDEKHASKIISNFIYYVLFNGLKKADDLRANGKVGGPFTILISPTMRCNLKCIGCYANEYDKEHELDLETVNRIIIEGKKLGTYFYTFLGGEPFIWPYLFEVIDMHPDCVFQIFTNGTSLNDEKMKKLLALKNVSVNFSIEGMEEETNGRRGPGIFQRVTESMEKYKQLGGLFGISVTVTSKNFELVTSNEFLSYMERLGAVYGWYFMYMPVGKEASTDLMITPKQRIQMGEALSTFRRNNPLLLMDFFNDAPFVTGCIAGGRYVHINHKGDLEPCIFCHYASSNIHDMSLEDALGSAFFKSIQKRQPYNENMLTPCMMIDHPEVWREIYAENGVNIYPTHSGANDILFKEQEFFNDYGQEIGCLTRPIWDEIYSELREEKAALKEACN